MNRDSGHAAELKGLHMPDHTAAAVCLTITSFGYKSGQPPAANMIFDVRFLKNPYWVAELRPLTGLDQSVREFVLAQEAAADFLESLMGLLIKLLERYQDLDISDFSIALGCTGGQHRSTALVEALAERLAARFPEFQVKRCHRELDEVAS